ncbi:MAG: class II aldolase/adducin family protein [Bacteroidales bacterium]|nr:class II aldolase/adducin family protein [Bacteroidales bacterium]
MTEKDLKTLRKEVACYMRRLYNRGLTTASGGNISVRTPECILITPSALDKGNMRGRQIGMMLETGENLTPELKPSIESAMHLAIYKTRPDVFAIVHAHPPVATSFTAMDKEINCTLIAEARAILGIPVMAPYALMGTKELAAVVAEAASTRQQLNNVILLQNHGIVCLGKDLLTAFDRLEVLEAAARMTLITGTGQAKPLSPAQLEALDQLMGNTPAHTSRE